MSIISRVGVAEEVEDSMRWTHSSNGEFTGKSFLEEYNKSKEQDCTFARLLWRSLVPPKVELLTWFVIHEKLNTRER
ncbi:hypothetical protein PIB30_013380, partial [Stylosanthes scabra]|nr:hypothetical protein [Stylosanthes scabra]